MDNLDRIQEILQCVGRIWSECPIENVQVRDDLQTIVDNIQMIKTELLELLRAELRWIPVEDALPERGKDVLVYYPRWHNDMFCESGIVVAQLTYDGLTWDICGEFNPGLHEISHWMSLPEHPIAKDNGGADNG